MHGFIAGLKMAAFFMWCLLCVPLQMLVLMVTRGPAAYYITYLWQKGVCKIFGLHVTVSGHPAHHKQTLFVSNHTSYLDIPVIGSVLRASFVAKDDVKSWPVFGFLSTLQQTAFISRNREDAAKEKNSLNSMLRDGKSLIVFPEGTSTDGRSVREFKSSLFSLAFSDEAKNMVIQPFTMIIYRVDGKTPEDQDVRDIYAWHIDMNTPLPAHLWRFAKSRGAHIHLAFHNEMTITQYTDRKILAKACYDAVRNGLENRFQPDTPTPDHNMNKGAIRP